VRDRAGGEAGRFCDVLYADLLEDPLQTIVGVYDHFDMHFGAEAESRIRAAVQAKPHGRHGHHRYDFSHTGWDPRAERERFSPYQQRYGVVSED
jgi:hypothetical protein